MHKSAKINHWWWSMSSSSMIVGCCFCCNIFCFFFVQNIFNMCCAVWDHLSFIINLFSMERKERKKLEKDYSKYPSVFNKRDKQTNKWPFVFCIFPQMKYCRFGNRKNGQWNELVNLSSSSSLSLFDKININQFSQFDNIFCCCFSLTFISFYDEKVWYIKRRN
mgnify:CR=1 FL=1